VAWTGSLPLIYFAGEDSSALVGAVLGLGVGLPGFLVLEAPLWLVPWVGLIALLGWVGYSAEQVFAGDGIIGKRFKRGVIELRFFKIGGVGQRKAVSPVIALCAL
jgi:hypothetical protein